VRVTVVDAEPIDPALLLIATFVVRDLAEDASSAGAGGAAARRRVGPRALVRLRCNASPQMRIDRLDQQVPFITADGSSIREVAGVPSGNAVQQSLAEATVPAGAETVEHYHRVAEEIYHFVRGAGRLRLGSEVADVSAGDTVVIPAGVRHKLWNRGSEPLVLLCCCAPPYSHDDTVLCE
jgi:mannose-6-phosphate isomerase-like protein (cupin superfamily)